MKQVLASPVGEKLSAEPTDEGLMVVVSRWKLELYPVNSRTSSPCSAETFSFKEKEGFAFTYKNRHSLLAFPIPQRMQIPHKAFEPFIG